MTSTSLSRLTLVALVLAGALTAQKKPLAHEDYWLLKRIGAPVVSPDGKWVVMSVTEPSYDRDAQVSDLWLAPVDGAAPPKRLTNTRAAEAGVAWSPDGKRLAFSTRREGDDVAQIYLLPLDGGEARRVTSLSTGATRPRFRPDGRALLFESLVYPGATDDAAQRKIAEERKARKYNARVYDLFPIRFWETWLDDRHPRAFVMDLDSEAEPRGLLAGSVLAARRGFAGSFSPSDATQLLEPIWAPDGASIIFAARENLDQTMYAQVETHLYRVAATGGEPVRITEADQSYGQASFSPDGKTLYATVSRNPHPPDRIYTLTRLVAWPWPALAEAKILTRDWDRSVSSFAVASDSRTIFLAAEDEGFDKLFRVPAGGGKVDLLFAVTAGGFGAPATADAGPADVLVSTFGTAGQPPEIVRIDAAAGSHTYLTRFNRKALDRIAFGDTEHFWFTAKNGQRLHNLITFPPGLDRTKKYPLIIFPHGGPATMSKDAFSSRWNIHYLAASGYVILQTNYTGSTGFGEKFADGIERDVLRGPAQELLEAIEEAGKRYPFLDLSRQAAIGGSYGGYLMNWLNGHTDQFRCIVNHAGPVNNESQYGTNDGGLSRELRMGVPIWEQGGQWNDQSPIRYSQNWRTPMLITHGVQDFRVPYSEGLTVYKILQRRQVPTRLVLFPDAGHWVLRGEDSKYHMQEVRDWLKKYLEPAEPVRRP
jgi:dipeptidyl aminopeptidase/acylaminoacyl peptidase